MVNVIPVLLTMLCFPMVVGGFVFLAVVLWRIAGALQSIVESTKVVAETIRQRSQSA